MGEVERRFGVTLPQLDLGGGYGIGYTAADAPRPAAAVAQDIARAVQESCRRLGLQIPHLSVEPGRSITGPAGISLYTVGTCKSVTVRDGLRRRYLSVDGGMSDNPRPQLYDARYTALSATRADEYVDELVSVAGMHCESGDVLIDDVALPSPRRGDLLAVPATGAYTLAMASNYNGVTRPAAVLVRDGEARVIRRREAVDDLLRHEVL